MAPAGLKRDMPDGTFYSEDGGKLLVFSQESKDGVLPDDVPDTIKGKLKAMLLGCEITDVLIRSDSYRVSAICWAEAISNRENKKRLRTSGAIAI